MRPWWPIILKFIILYSYTHCILTFTLQVNIPEHSFLERVPDHQRDRKLNGSSRSMASTHPMLAGAGTSTSTHPGPYIGGGGIGQSPDMRGSSLRQHLSAEASSLTSKVHTVILTGLFVSHY